MTKNIAVRRTLLATALAACTAAVSTQTAAAAATLATTPAVSTAAAAAVQPVPLRLEPLGDSITWGTDSTTGDGYRLPLWNNLTGQGYPLNFVGTVSSGSMADNHNEGHPGYRIDQIASLTDASLAAYQPNIVTLMAGTNDMIQSYQLSTAPARLSSLIDQITTDDPGAVVLVASLTIGTNSSLAANEPAYNATIPGIVSAKQAAGKHVVFVDMSALTAADLNSDGIHPNDGGYQKMAAAWTTGVQNAAGNGWLTAPVALSTGATAAGPTGEIASGITGDCLDVSGSNTANGTSVQLWQCNHTGAQTWTAYSDGTLRALGKCLNATGAGTANGTTLQLWDCTGGANQVFQAYNGGYLNLVSSRCIDDPFSSTTSGTQQQLWDCNGQPNQQWSPPEPAHGPVASGYAGKCLDDYGDSLSIGTQVDIWDCNGSAAQQWSYNQGTLQINGKCLDVTGGQVANGTPVEIWDCNNGANQQWTASNGALVNPASGRCLDDPDFNTTNGTPLEIWDCNGGTNQQWALPTG